jgi:hypothetical protein
MGTFTGNSEPAQKATQLFSQSPKMMALAPVRKRFAS